MPNKCYCAEYIDEKIKEKIRENVCEKGLEAEYKKNGKYYCILHFPDNKKHANTTYNQVIEQRLKDQKNDFSYVYFSDKIDFSHHIFSSEAFFNNAVFAQTANFQFTTFSGKCVFTSTKFNKEVFANFAKFQKGVFFEGAIFSGYSDFSSSSFTGKDINVAPEDKQEYVSFKNAIFSQKTNFIKATFNDDVIFSGAVFEEKSETLFTNVIFQGNLIFADATFKGLVIFGTNNEKERCLVPDGFLIDFFGALFDNPKKTDFRNVRLRPNWFVNSDVSEINFFNIRWFDSKKTIQDSIEEELKILFPERKMVNAEMLLKTIFRQLANNYQEKDFFAEASIFRLTAFETERIARKNKRKAMVKRWGRRFRLVKYLRVKRKWEAVYWGFLIRLLLLQLKKSHWEKIVNKRSYSIDVTHFLYRALSNYGESWLRAFCWLFMIWLVSLALYSISFSEFKDANKPLELTEAMSYSLRVMILQRPDPFPINNFAKFVVAFESAFAPIQAALLALAIRRKFMR